MPSIAAMCDLYRDGVFIDNITVGDSLIAYYLPTLTERGKTFLGWYTEDGTKVEAGYTITTDLYLYSKWEINKVVIDEPYLYDIADAIRMKNNTESTYKPGEMSNAIESIETGGSGGGGSVETCTVELSTDVGGLASYAYSCVIDGKITSVYTNGSVDLNSVTLHDIVCGSFIVVNFTNNVAPETSIGVEFLGGGASVWKIIANAGETAVLSFYSPF